jgi:hypothetical protein
MSLMTGTEVENVAPASTQDPDRSTPDDQGDLVTVLRTHGPLATKRIGYNRKTGKHRIADYGRARVFSVKQHQVSNIHQSAALLDTLGQDPRTFVIRGEPIGGIDRTRCLRRIQDQTNPETGEFEPATFTHAARHALLIDVDGVPCPASIDPLHDPDEVVEYVVSLLPTQFHGVTCWWLFTSGHGIKEGVRIRLAFYSTRKLSTDELKAWLGELIPLSLDRGSKANVKRWPVDTSVFNPVQPNYIAKPVFEGCHDPVPYRSGVWVGLDDAFTPPDIDLNKRRQWGGYSSAAPASPGMGYEGWRDLIGDHSGLGFYPPIKAAIATYFRKNGSEADPNWVRADLEQAILERGHTRDSQCIRDRIKALDGLIRHIQALQAADEIRRREQPFTVSRGQKVYKTCRLNCTAPTSTIDEACAALNAALAPVILEYVPDAVRERRQWVNAAAIAEAEGKMIPPAPIPRQVGIAADMAAGKTEAALEHTLTALATHTDHRVLYAIPNHETGSSTVYRINTKARREVARVWQGMERPDLKHPGRSMCHRLAQMKEVIEANGAAGLLCGSRRRGYCERHEKGCSEIVCGMQRQALAAADENIKIWLVPHALLPQALPSALQRPMQTAKDSQGDDVEYRPDAFDFVIIDEAPWAGTFGGIGETPYTLSLNDLHRPFTGDWSVPEHAGDPEGLPSQRLGFLCSIAHKCLSTPGLDYVTRSALTAGESPLTPELCREARRLVFRLLQDPADMVNPTDLEGGVNEAIKFIAERNRVVMAMARMWKLLALACDLPEATDRTPYLRVKGQQIEIKWRRDLSDQITALPIVYLDGTMNPKLAQCWLERLEVVATAQAKTPTSVYRRQVGDSAIAHRAIAPNKKSSEKDLKTQHNNIARLARLLELRAAQFRGQGQPNDEGEIIDGAVICPLSTRRALEEKTNGQALLPETFAVANQNNVRGSNRYRAVGYGSTISRPQAPPTVAEMLAWLTLGRIEEGLAPGEWYPSRPAGLLMRDGTGREVEQEFHPHALAEA